MAAVAEFVAEGGGVGGAGGAGFVCGCGAGAAGAGPGAGVLGAETPAISEPRPSFCRLTALILPLASSPFSDWNFCMALTVFKSHLPLGSLW